MVSQNQENEWGNSPSRTGSMLSLDGRQRPVPAKTPPSYYDAVRSRHSLSQPVNKSPESIKQDKSLHVQQVKYNSLPRPLPQRYPPAAINHHQPKNVWTEDSIHRNGNGPSLCGPRQQYDSPPKPANRVPLQLQVHQERGSGKHGDQNSCHQGYIPAPRGMEYQRMTTTSRQSMEKLDCNSREMTRKEPMLSMPMRVDSRPPPPIPGRRPPQPRASVPNEISSPPSNLMKRDMSQSSGSLRRLPMPVNGSHTLPNEFPPSSRTVVDGTSKYEPRYSKSGKLSHRLPTQDPRPMPPPVVMLRTGPLGTYPDPETLLRSEMASYNHRQDRSFSTGDYEPQYQRCSADGNATQKSFRDTNSYCNPIGDHSNTSFRRPPVSPHDTRPTFEEFQQRDKVNARKDVGNHLQQPPSLTQLHNSGNLSNSSLNAKSHTLPGSGRIPMDCFNPIREYASHNQQQRNLPIQHRNENAQALGSKYSKSNLSSDDRVYVAPDESGAIYANHEISPHPTNGNRIDHAFDLQRSQSSSDSNGPLYENSSSFHTSPRDGFRSIQEPESVYANYQVEAHYMSGHAISNLKQQECQQITKTVENGPHSTSKKNPTLREQQTDRRNTHPPPVAQKPVNSLPQPSEITMIAESRGWNSQPHINSYNKEVVKPTPRLPRFANGLIASSAQLTTVPAYQCVINELSTRPFQHTSPTATDSSTLSLRSGYDSSSSSSRDFSRRPCKSDSSIEQLRSLEGEVRPINGYRQIDKSLLSASMTSLCSEASSSLSSRRRQVIENSSRDRINDEFQKRQEKGSVFSASPWEREAKEKLQKEQVLDARRARDQEISHLESIADRSEKQEEWLRILRLEREFQRRAEQELDDEEDEGSVNSESTESDKTESFHGDKLTVIPNERMGLKLLEELLDSTPSQTIAPPEKNINKRELTLGNPLEKHFIPLDVAIPENNLQPSSLPLTNNILKISSEQNPDAISHRLSKPPVPAPRPSKIYTPVPLAESQECGISFEGSQDPNNDGVNSNVSSSLAKLEISDASAYFCSTETDLDSSVSDPQNSWLIEVPSEIPPNREESYVQKSKQNGAESRIEHSRIYENIKPADYQCLKTQLNPPSNGFNSHTLPKSNSSYSLSSAKEVIQPRSGSRFSDRKFPSMGVSSTLTKKSNGFSPSDADILPSLYASCKTRSEIAKDVPADLVDKSPEFKKMWITRPEKLTFQDKIRKFSLQAGDDDVPRDRIKNSKAQREIENRFSDMHKRATATQKSVES